MDEYAKEIDVARAEIDTYLAEIEALEDEAGKRLVADFAETWTAYLAINGRVLDYARLNSNIEARHLSEHGGLDAYDETVAALNDLVGTVEGVRGVDPTFLRLHTALLRENMLLAIRAEKDVILATADDEMRQYEAAASESYGGVTNEIGILRDIVGETGADALAEVERQWSEYVEIADKVIALSLENGKHQGFRAVGRGRRDRARPGDHGARTCRRG